mgnify:CR=1 FL=1
MNMSIRENIQQVRENIAAAALSAGRRPEDITLVGASKMNDAAACRAALAPSRTPPPRASTRSARTACRR